MVSVMTSKSEATIRRALDLGINFLDTTDGYGLGHNEELIGAVTKDRRREAVIATKFGVLRNNDGSYAGFNGTPNFVKSSCEASLNRLGVEIIDVYYLGRVDPQTPIEESVGAMADLLQGGKIRAIGLCEVSAETIRRAHSVHPISAVQTEYSLWSRDVENQVLPTCRELGITLVAYSPLGRGFFAGRIKEISDLSANDQRRWLPRFLDGNLRQNYERLMKPLEEMANEKGLTSAQLALAWLLTHEGVVPIPGTRNQNHLSENVGALEIKLSRDDIIRIDEISKPDLVAGLRYPEEVMQTVNR